MDTPLSKVPIHHLCKCTRIETEAAEDGSSTTIYFDGHDVVSGFMPTFPAIVPLTPGKMYRLIVQEEEK